MTYPRQLVDTSTMYETLSRTVPAGTSLAIMTRCHASSNGCFDVATVTILDSIAPDRYSSAIHYGVTKNGVRVVLSQDPEAGWMARFGLDDEACFELGFSDLAGCAIPDDEADDVVTTSPEVVYHDGSGSHPLHVVDPMYV